MQRADGMNYAPTGMPDPVCGKGDFRFAVIGLDHGHIYGMCNGLIEAGAEIKWVYDPDPEKVAAFCKKYEQVKNASSEEEILEDDSVRLIASANIPSERCALGLRAMDHGKDYFTDKPPFTTLEQLNQARIKTTATTLKYLVYYAERYLPAGSFNRGLLVVLSRLSVSDLIELILIPDRTGFFKKKNTAAFSVTSEAIK